MSEYSVVNEFLNAELGDKRRTDRLLQLVERFSENPQASLPQLLGDEAQLEAAYRLLSNPAVDAADVLHPHIMRSAARAATNEVSLVLHDTTDIRFDCYGDVLRKNLSRPTAHTQGFRLHSALAVSADGTRFPLGVLAARAFVHKTDVKDENALQWWAERDGIMENEQERWLQGILAAEENAPTTLHIVEVLERNPPKEETPLRWILATTEPISTPDQVLEIVDYYCSRWVIEEFHKAVKSGCSYEKRQLASAHALLNTLSMTIPVAVHMLMLRDLTHTNSTAPAEALFSKEELLVLRALSSEKALPSKPQMRHALDVIAQVGGHIKANGPPGWLVLYRGYVELIHAKKGFIAAFKMMNMPLPEL